MGKLLGSLEKSFYNIRSFLMGSSQEGSSRSEKINDIEKTVNEYRKPEHNAVKYTWQDTNSAGLYFKTNGKRCVITRYRGDSDNVLIPDEIDGKPVRAIASGAFRKTLVKTVYIPDSVTKIGNEAFAGSCLCSAEFPKNIEYVGDRAFYGCRNLRAVSSRRKNLILVRFGDEIFHGTYFYHENQNKQLLLLNNLLVKFNDDSGKTVIIPDTVGRILSNAFTGSSVSEIILPEKYISIDKNAFYGSNYLKKLIAANSFKIVYGKPILRVKCAVERNESTSLSDKGIFVFGPFGVHYTYHYYGVSTINSDYSKLSLRLDEYLEYGSRFTKEPDKICFAYTYIRLTDRKSEIERFTDFLLKNKRPAIRCLMVYDEPEMMEDLINWRIIDENTIDYAVSKAEKYNCCKCLEYLKKECDRELHPISPS